MRTTTINAYGKINLTLDIIGKRSDGYHELESLMQQVNLHDEVEISVSSGNRIVVSGDGEQIPVGEDNIAFRAVKVLQDYIQETFSANIFIQKKIPVAGGMAGGSANAAAVLIGLNEVLSLNLEQKTLENLGLQIGADVPFCVAGGTAIARGIGEILTPFNPPPKLWIVIVKPDFGLSTALVYKKFSFGEVINRPKLDKVLQGIKTGQVQEIYDGMGNVLESASFKLAPALLEIKKKLLEWGAEQVMMSGSGPTMLAFVADKEKAAALTEKARSRFPSKYQIETTYTKEDKEGVIQRNGE